MGGTLKDNEGVVENTHKMAPFARRKRNLPKGVRKVKDKPLESVGKGGALMEEGVADSVTDARENATMAMSSATANSRLLEV